MKGAFTFLGTSGASGIPVIGCQCEVCSSHSRYNKRLRASILIEVLGKNLLVDIGPDFRLQALEKRIERLDGILLTHTHFDHIAGLDELRVFNFRMKKPLPCLLSQESYEDLRRRYDYLFEAKGDNFTAKIDCHVLKEDSGSCQFEGITVHYMSYFQGKTKVTGFRLGDFAYLTDIKQYPLSIFQSLKDVHKLVISAARFSVSDLQLSVDEAIAFANQVKADKVWLTHISHDIEHHKTEHYLPSHIRLAYDQLSSEFYYPNLDIEGE